MRDFGFRYVSFDLLGYRTGSMNEALHFSEIPRSSNKITFELRALAAVGNWKKRKLVFLGNHSFQTLSMC